MYGGRPFDIQRRIKQGDILTPLWTWQGKCGHHGIAMGHPERLTNIRHANDLMSYARSIPSFGGEDFFFPRTFLLQELGLGLLY